MALSPSSLNPCPRVISQEKENGLRREALNLVPMVAKAAEKALDEYLEKGYPQVEIPAIGICLAKSNFFYRFPCLRNRLQARAFRQVYLVSAFAKNEFLKKLEGKYLPQGWEGIAISSMFVCLKESKALRA